MELRPYQKEAVGAVLREWENGNKKVLIVLGTGCGKTIIFSNIVKIQVEKGHRVLILAHRGELLSQAAEKLKMATGLESSLEKAESSCFEKDAPVVVGSVQTMARESRLAKFPSDYFQDIVIDEAHHSVSSTYQKILAHFPDAIVLGVTATPDRGDMRNLGSCFDTLAYEYNIADAIRDGYLTSIKAQTIPLELDISDVSVSGGDYVAGELGNALDPYLRQIAEKMLEYCRGRKTIVFTPLVKTSQKFCEILNEEGFAAAEVHGESKDREEILKAFSRGTYNTLVNSMLVTEGYDEPSVDCIVCLRPTRSKSLYTQIVGRGTRLFEGKKDLLLLDFLWLTDRLGLCHPSTLISSDAEVSARMDELYAKGGLPTDIRDMEKMASADVTAQREAALVEMLRLMRKKQASFVDPLQYVASTGYLSVYQQESVFKWEEKKPTKKQLEFIQKLGISAEGITTKGQASKIIGILMEKRRMGGATPKQVRLLERYGFEHVGQWTMKKAGKAIDAIAENHWNITPMIFQMFSTSE